MNDSLTNWFINYVNDFENNIQKDNYIHNAEIDEFEEMTGVDEIIKSKEHLKLDNTYISNILSHEFNKQTDIKSTALNFIKEIVNYCKNNKLTCFNCKNDTFVFRTGKYGDFIYCKTCKCSLSESSYKKKILNS